MEKFKLHEVKIYFSAPPKTSTETLTIEKEKAFEANFQWSFYQILFLDKEMNRYIYQATLQPWGEIMSGVAEVSGANTTWKVDKAIEINIDPTEIEKSFSTLLGSEAKKPDLFPKNALVSYVNMHKSEKGKSYKPEEFKNNFGDDFYVLLTKTKDLVNPIGGPISKKPEEELNRSAVKVAKEKDYFTGGFDIMKKLFRKQHRKQNIRKKGAVHWGDPEERKHTLTEEEREMKKLLTEEYKKQNKNLLDELTKHRSLYPQATLGKAIQFLFNQLK